MLTCQLGGQASAALRINNQGSVARIERDGRGPDTRNACHRDMPPGHATGTGAGTGGAQCRNALAHAVISHSALS